LSNSLGDRGQDSWSGGSGAGGLDGDRLGEGDAGGKSRRQPPPSSTSPLGGLAGGRRESCPNVRILSISCSCCCRHWNRLSACREGFGGRGGGALLLLLLFNKLLLVVASLLVVLLSEVLSLKKLLGGQATASARPRYDRKRLSFSLPNSSSGSETMVKNITTEHYRLHHTKLLPSLLEFLLGL